MATNKEKSQKWGANALARKGRQGLEELQAAGPFGDSPIAQPTNYAMPGVATPGEVTEARREESPSLDDDSVVGSRINQVGPPRDDRGRDERERGMDRD